MGVGVTDDRTAFPPFPHQDDIRVVSPLSLLGTPIADTCARTLVCRYEEDLATEDVTPRWYEAASGTQIFSLIRTPLTLDDYLSGSGSIYEKMIAEQTTDAFIPAYTDTVCRAGGRCVRPWVQPCAARAQSAWADLQGSCSSGGCFPREVKLIMTYYQVSKVEKRLIELSVELSSFDRNPDNLRCVGQLM